MIKTEDAKVRTDLLGSYSFQSRKRTIAELDYQSMFEEFLRSKLQMEEQDDGCYIIDDGFIEYY